MTPIPNVEESLGILIRAVEGYLDDPGCNIPARVNALRKLRWATEQATKVIEDVRTTHAERMADRTHMGELQRKLTKS